MRQLKASASRSLSAQTNRLKRAQAERSLDREHGGKLGKEDHDKGRHKRHMEVKDFSRDRKSSREKNDGVSSKSSSRDHSNSPRDSSLPLTRASKVGHGVTCLQKPSFELSGKLAEETNRVQDKQSLYMCTGRIFTFVVEKRGCRHPNRSSIL
ncbi:FHA domain-containing protein DDL-like isoform X1 [Musa acuminata AAA Group]|uniref:FHA domain-containing protein DDL-like isoform X1 n=1 Tax=Musa acuminata AAA Group TaxID=214697 RepID=UPI0031DAE229